jgi:hypothetical protein
MGADMGQDQVGRDRRHLIQARLPELALDDVFLGETEAAMGLQALIGGVPERFRRQERGRTPSRISGWLSPVFGPAFGMVDTGLSLLSIFRQA